MMKFKVGDKVKYVGESYDFEIGVGIIINITEGAEAWPFDVLFEDDPSWEMGFACAADELELITNG